MGLEPARDLLHAAPARAVAPAVERAAQDAATHARALLQWRGTPLPVFTFMWVDHPRGVWGQAVTYGDGRCEIRLRADIPARTAFHVVLHECRHLVDHRLQPTMAAVEAERRADEFACVAAQEWDRARERRAR